MIEAEGRAKVIDAAKSYLRTPYVHRGRVRGAGVDCATLICLCYEQVGLIEPFELPSYSAQWGHHTEGQNYLEWFMRHSKETDEALASDVVMFQLGRVWSHAGIVIDWPIIIHARDPSGVEYADALRDGRLSRMGSDRRPMKFFSYWKKMQ